MHIYFYKQLNLTVKTPTLWLTNTGICTLGWKILRGFEKLQIGIQTTPWTQQIETIIRGLHNELNVLARQISDKNYFS